MSLHGESGTMLRMDEKEELRALSRAGKLGGGRMQ